MANVLLGHWRLKHYYTCEDGREVLWDGPQDGTLTYAEDGMVSVYMNRTAPGQDLSEEENKILNSWYKGTYRLVDKDNVIHTVQESSLPERVGCDLVRRYKLEADQLIITGMGLRNSVKLIWEKDK